MFARFRKQAGSLLAHLPPIHPWRSGKACAALDNIRAFIASSLTFSICAASLWASAALAEGSRSLYPRNATGSRANLVWSNNLFSGNIRDRTLLKVYAAPGQYILLGSSAVGVNQGDVWVYEPGQVTGNIGQESIPGIGSTPGTPVFKCSSQPGRGKINSRAEELAGPQSIDGKGNLNGYVPCFYKAVRGGIYDVAIFGPTGNNSPYIITPQPTGEIELTSPGNFDATTQQTSVAAWDVTVRNDEQSVSDLSGRLFSYYLDLFTGFNNRPVNSTLYTVTTDGYRYKTDLNGVDPNGFVLYGNRVGFLNPDGVTPLFRDLVAGDADSENLANPQAGVILARPEFPLFFNIPREDTLSQIQPPDPGIPGVSPLPSIPLVATKPSVSGFSFSGTAPPGSNNSTFSTGGSFTYSANIEHVYEIVISRDRSNFDPTNPQNRVLRGVRARGTQTVAWDGKDNSGDPFPIGNNYPAQVKTNSGNYHFPLLDSENSAGGPALTLINPPGSCPPLNGGCSGGFYDDRGYRTTNGATIGTVGSVLPGNVPPTSSNSDPINGFDTRIPQRRYGNGSSDGFGDKKGLDLWTYYPSNALRLDINIVSTDPDLSIQKSHKDDFIVGLQGTYTLQVKNSAGAGMTNGPVTVTDTLPTGLSFVSGSGTNWNCSASGQTVTCTYTGSALAPGASAPDITLSVNVSSAAAPGVTNTATVTTPGDTDPNNNKSDDPTKVSLASPAGTKSVRLFADADSSGSVTKGDTVEYSITYTNNDPNIDVISFQANDSIDTSKLSFVPGSYSFTAMGTGTTVSGNPSYNGTTDTKLNTIGTLGRGGGQVIIKFRAVIIASAGSQINNQAVATSAGGTLNISITNGVANTGDIPQVPDDNINQGNLPSTADDNPTVLTVVEPAPAPPRLLLVKRITAATRNGAPLAGINFGSFANDPANSDDDAPGWSQLQPVGVFNIGSGTPLFSGDQVEYTVYFLSDGGTPVNSVNVCDLIPPGTTFVPNTILAQSGNGVPISSGSFFSPLAPLPAGNSCSNQTNPDGAVIVNLGNIPNTAGGNVGFIRFRVSIN